MLNDIQSIILAGGKSTRFNTGKTKLIEKVCGQALILYPLTVLKQMHIPQHVVIGCDKSLVQKAVESHDSDVPCVEQEQPLGTADAVKATRAHWEKKYILLMKADIPLLTQEMITGLYEQHHQTNATLTFITAHNDNPTGFSYGRVITKDDRITIARPHELTPEQLQEYCCINGGIILINRDFLEEVIDKIEQKNYSHEYHMSDLINLATEHNKTVTTYSVPFDSIRSINNLQELWAAEQIKRAELIRYWMDRGVRFSSAQSVHIDLNVQIGAGSHIGCGVHLINGTKIGKNCHIYPSAMIDGSTLGDNVLIDSHSIVRKTTIKDNAQIGPFAHIQEGCTIGEHTQIGNFVEMKRTQVGSHSKAKHLSYLGDATIGNNVNIGAGTITCNYDGKNKNQTVIKDYVFIGTNNSLVAPVTVHEKSFTAAGSVITDDVPEEALAIGRARQVNKEGYAKKLRAKERAFSFVGAVKTTNETPTEV